MAQCKECGSYAINHAQHGRDGSDGDLCDVCYWKKRAERDPLTDDEILGKITCSPLESAMFIRFARAIESAHGIKGK